MEYSVVVAAAAVAAFNQLWSPLIVDWVLYLRDFEGDNAYENHEVNQI